MKEIIQSIWQFAKEDPKEFIGSIIFLTFLVGMLYWVILLDQIMRGV
jgi:hypothetical protein